MTPANTSTQTQPDVPKPVPPLSTCLFGDVFAHSALDFAHPALSLPIRLCHTRTCAADLHTKQLTTILKNALKLQPCIYTYKPWHPKARYELLREPFGNLKAFLRSQRYQLYPLAETVHHYKDMSLRKGPTRRHIREQVHRIPLERCRGF